MTFTHGIVYVVITHGSCVDRTTAVLTLKTTAMFFITHLNSGITLEQAQYRTVRDNSDMKTFSHANNQNA